MALIKCPECGATISDKAEACPTCGCPKSYFGIGKDKQEEWSSQQTESGTPKSADVKTPANTDSAGVNNKPTDVGQYGCTTAILAGVGFVLFLLFMIAVARSCGNKSTNSASEAAFDSIAIDTVYEDTTAIAIEEDKNTLQWKYSEEKEELSGKTTYFAYLVSENYTTFDFPYNHSPIYLTLNIRKSPRYGTDVYLTIPEGQFHTRYDGTYISVRFDNGSVARYSCSEPSDNSTTVLFVNGAQGFIKKLKNSKECRISAEFYQEGSPTFTFNTEGLEWNH